MPKRNQTIKNLFDFLFNSLVIILLIFFYRTNSVYGANNNWIKVSKTIGGIQYLDKNSLERKGEGVIEIKTKYLKIDVNTLKEIEKNIYIMRINCLTNQFKDISVNGNKNLTAKWEYPNGDKLLNDVIIDSCKNA